MKLKKQLEEQQASKLLGVLRERFENNMARHQDVVWKAVQFKLEKFPEKLWILNEMERTGGEPDVICVNNSDKDFTFFDCAAETPTGRRSLCYDKEAWEARKENKPQGNALDAANNMGIEILTEEQYRYLQQFGKFDTKTSSWIKTPESIRELGGALFCDRRYNHVFVYHNGAQSYYAVRGFRGLLIV